MKVHKIFLLLTSLFLLAGCDMFKLDNFEAPNASLKGGIKDELTGELVGTDIQSGSTIRAKELGWAEGGIMTWVVKQSGEFQNDMVFAGRYSLDFYDCNFFPFQIDEFVIKKGENLNDFQVTPYIRIKDASITKQGDQIVATFRLQAGKPEVRLSAVRLYAYSDMYVGEIVKYSITGPAYQTFSPAIIIDESTTYTLNIDIPSNTNEFFKYTGRNYYFRVGALASVSNVGTVRNNYSPLIVIQF